MKRCLTLLILLTYGLCLGKTAAASQFKHAEFKPLGSGEKPRRIVAVDLRNRGILDLVVADYLSSGVSILFGNGDGTFQKATRFVVSSPVAIAAGDFNGDGYPDLAIVEAGGTGDSTVVIFLNDGKGSFRQKGQALCGVYTLAVTVGDLDGDGNLDVAVANKGFYAKQSSVMIFFGDGHGSLKHSVTYRMGSTGPAGIAAGDLNGDQFPDLAVTNISGNVVVMLNDGTGHFKKQVTYNAGGGEVVDVKIADLRNDGRNDLVVANGSRGMVVLLNKGNGTFDKYALYQPNFFNWQPPEACTVADFNLDGKLDVACAAQIDDSYFFYGKGDGTFRRGGQIHDTIGFDGGFSIASGDFNHDGAPDLAIPIEYDGKVAILLNTQ